MDRKIFDWVLKIFLFLSPVFLFQNYRASMARGMFFILGVFALYALSLTLEPKRKLNNLWVGLFLLLAFVRMFIDNSVCEQPQMQWFNFWFSCASFMYVFCGVLLFQIVYTHAENIREYIKPIVWVCVINAILTGAQLIGKDFLWYNAPSVCGFMENSSQLGQYSALAFPLVFFFNPLLSLIPLFTLIVSKSISPILACAIGMSVLCVLTKRNVLIIPIVLSCVILAGIAGTQYISNKWSARPEIWQKTLRVSLQKPFVGYGYGSFTDKVSQVKESLSAGGPEHLRAHNDPLHTAQELGFPIVIVMGAFFFNLFKRFFTEHQEKMTYFLGASILIVLINMCGQTFIRYASTAGTFIVVLALFCVMVERGNHVIHKSPDM